MEPVTPALVNVFRMIAAGSKDWLEAWLALEPVVVLVPEAVVPVVDAVVLVLEDALLLESPSLSAACE